MIVSKKKIQFGKIYVLNVKSGYSVANETLGILIGNSNRVKLMIVSTYMPIRLYAHIHQILAASSKQLSQLALLEDKILKVTDSSVNFMSKDDAFLSKMSKTNLLTLEKFFFSSSW